jgi:hypothetical protein
MRAISHLRDAEANVHNAEDKPAALTNYIATRRRVA